MRKLDIEESTFEHSFTIGESLKIVSEKSKDNFNLEFKYVLKELEHWQVVDLDNQIMFPSISTRIVDTNITIPLDHFCMIGGLQRNGKTYSTIISVKETN